MSMPKYLFTSILAALGLAGLLTAAQAADNAPKIKVLLISGDDVEPAHNWREQSAATKDVLMASGKFDVKVREDAGILEAKSSLDRYDVVFLTSFNAKTPTLSAEAKENLLNFVKSGKGFFVPHLATASQRMGRVRQALRPQVGHGHLRPRPAQRLHGQDRRSGASDHQGPGRLHTDDELYAKLQGDTHIHVLLTADSDWSKKTEPLVLRSEYGRGRVVHEAYGHDRKALMTPTVQKIIIRGTEWAATGKVQ